MYRTLWFTHNAYHEMLRLAAKAADGRETGGHLFGYTYPSTGDVIVTRVLPAGPDTKRWLNGIDWDQEALKRYRRENQGDSQWEVGDFHTHPVADAAPSLVDDAEQRNYREQNHWNRLMPDVLVIIGVPPGGTIREIGAWYYTRDDRTKLDIRVAAADWNPVDKHGNWITNADAGA